MKVASTHVLPALVTLGSDQNLSVKYASIEAFGAVAQQFKNDMVLPAHDSFQILFFSLGGWGSWKLFCNDHGILSVDY